MEEEGWNSTFSPHLQTSIVAEGAEAAGEELLLTVLKGLNPAGSSANTPGKTYPWEGTTAAQC